MALMFWGEKIMNKYLKIQLARRNILKYYQSFLVGFLFVCFCFWGREARKTNVIYKYLLGSLILTFPICSEDNKNAIYFLGSILKALAGFSIYS